MQNLYQILQSQEGVHRSIIATVVEGFSEGEKLLLSDETILWQSCEGSFLAKHTEEICKVKKSQIIELNGQRVFCEWPGNEKTLVICGGGHVSIPIIQIGRQIGFRTIVLEDRPKFADNARRAGADQVLCDSFENGMKQIAGSTDTYFVIVTRGHRYDTLCLREAVQKPNAYVGMMGSRRRVALVKENLAAEGIDKALLEQVYTPIGLSIGAETPEEIAVAVLAEIIQVKNREKRTEGYEPEILAYLTGEKAADMGKVLSVIVSRRGSAPREVGTKMIVLEDGTIIGTIGGGCVEGEVISKSLSMLRQGEPKQTLMQVDMSGADAEDAGMVCGGTVEIYLELVQ